jgi:multimeric flavodoxin WrbA
MGKPAGEICVATVFHSGMGHTAAVAKAVRDGAASVPNTRTPIIYVTEIDDHWDELNAADAMIFGCPTYMGSASAAFKTFMDASSGIWAKLGWKDKLAAGFTNSGNPHGDKYATLLQLYVFAMQHAMLWVGVDLPGGHNSSKGSPEGLNRLGTWIGVTAQSYVDQGVEGINESDLRTAFHLGQRVALTAHRLRFGSGQGSADDRRITAAANTGT